MYHLYSCIQLVQLKTDCREVTGQNVLAADASIRLVCYCALHKFDILAASDFADSM